MFIKILINKVNNLKINIKKKKKFLLHVIFYKK